MSGFTSRRSAGGLLVVFLVILLSGCRQQVAVPDPAPAQTVRAGPTEPGEIELYDPQVTLGQDNRIRFEVHYRFTKGRPEKYYLCEISFPGTTNHGAKPMESWELKSEGIIKDGLLLHKPPVKTFEIRVSEADSPQDGYKKISNVVRGEVK
jgi:hypothetical protein